jgi:hypothetical protein
MRNAALATIGTVVLLAAQPAHAQPRPGQFALETVTATTSSTANAGDPSVVLDAATTVRLWFGFDAVVRPWMRRKAGAEWDWSMYQLQLQYQSATRIPVRVDAGIIASPLGLGTLELKPDVNPTIGSPSYYHAPLPQLDDRDEDLQLISGGYPWGAIVSVSGQRWDARAGFIDATPARHRKIRLFASDGPAMPQMVAGGGVTPRVGLRLGAGFARGAYRRTSDFVNEAESPVPPSSRDQNVTVVNLEAEYAFGFTRFSGEWVRDRFDTNIGSAVAQGFYVQVVHTLSPRVFAAGRVLRVSSPAYVKGAHQRRTMGTAELTTGYRVTPDWTVKGGYQGSRKFGRESWSHAAVASLVWSQRWFK